MVSSLNHLATSVGAGNNVYFLLQYYIDAGAAAYTGGNGDNGSRCRCGDGPGLREPPTLSQFNILLYPSTLSQFNILLYPRASPAAASRGTVTAPLPARGDGTAACPGRRRPAPARGYDRPDSKGLHSRRSGATAHRPGATAARCRPGATAPLPARDDGGLHRPGATTGQTAKACTAAGPGRRRQHRPGATAALLPVRAARRKVHSLKRAQ